MSITYLSPSIHPDTHLSKPVHRIIKNCNLTHLTRYLPRYQNTLPSPAEISFYKKCRNPINILANTKETRKFNLPMAAFTPSTTINNRLPIPCRGRVCRSCSLCYLPTLIYLQSVYVYVYILFTICNNTRYISPSTNQPQLPPITAINTRRRISRSRSRGRVRGGQY